MGYPANAISSTRTFRVGIGRFPDIARPPGHRLTPDRFRPPRKSSLCIPHNFFGHLPFSKIPKTLKKGALVSNPHFTGGFQPEGGPTSTREHFHSMPKVIPKISIPPPKSFHFEKNANWKIPKKSSGHKPNPAFSDRK